MLRWILILISTTVLVCAVVAALAGYPGPGAMVAVVYAAVVFAGIVFERNRYKGVLDVAPAGFEATDERFVDPTSGVATIVYFNAKTGQRAYVKA